MILDSLHWGDSRLRLPDHVANLLVLLAIAYTWMVALGSQAVGQIPPQPLVRRPDGSFRRLWSLFREGLRYFVQVVQRYTLVSGIYLHPRHKGYLKRCPLLSRIRGGVGGGVRNSDLCQVSYL